MICALIVNVPNALVTKTLPVLQASAMQTVTDMQRTAPMTVPVPRVTAALVMMSCVLHVILTVMHVQLTMRQITVDVPHVLAARSRVIQLSSSVLLSVQLDIHQLVHRTAKPQPTSV